ncbi:MAG: GGDEF domain-containing protein [Sulfuricurvum sp.]|nr:GGDEF domain-containing protein [Sulfuricurvum sp.]
MRQMTLRTFFASVYIFLMVLIGSYFLYAFDQYKQHLAESTSQRAVGLMHELENMLIPIANVDKFYLIEPIIASMPEYRSFIRSASLSLNNNIILFSSDKKLIGKPRPKAVLIKNNTIASDILAGETSFVLPITYFTDGKELKGSLLLTLVPQTLSADDFLIKVYTNFMLSSAFFALIIGMIFLMIRHYVVLPLRVFDTLVLDKKRKPLFFISDLATIYNRLSDSYFELEEKKKSLESALYVKDYLYEILHTMDLVNRLLISDKSIQEIMDESCELLAKHGLYNLTWIGNIVDENIIIVAHSDDPSGYTAQLDLSIDPADPTSQGPSAQSILTNQTIITSSVNVEYYAQWHDKAIASGHGSSICLPLRGSANENAFATLAIYASKPFGFLAEEITMLEDLAGDIGYAIASRKKKAELQLALTTDHLTGLPNRALLLESLHQLEDPRLLLININRFRDINTVYGFDAGDFILHSCADCLSHLIEGEAGTLFKLHSDTFAILLKKVHAVTSAEELINNLSHHLAEHSFFYNGIDIWITIAAGYSDSAEQTIENAEIALKRAKEQKIPFQPFSMSMRLNKEHEENIAWYKIIKDAIKDGRMVPYFQAITNNQTGEVSKYEALVRIIMPDGTIISPFKFLDIAKKTGLYPQLTKAMVHKTIATFQDLPYTVSLNLSTEDITNADMVSFLRDTIVQSSIGKKIVFEILESEGISNYDLVSEFINEFKQLGCQFAIDDFGSGFSNFEHLIKLQVDFLKIDGSLIKNLPHDKNAQVIVKNIQNFAAEMGIATIAEFVSSHEIYEIVNAMGITYSQGYYFSEPAKEVLPIDRIMLM